MAPPLATSTSRSFAQLAAIVTSCTLVAPAFAGNSLIKDHGSIFSADVAAQLDDELELLHRQYLTRVVVETYRKVPAYKFTNVQALDEEQREKFFDDWTKKKTKASGVHVLICLDPAPVRVKVSVGKQTQIDGAFTLRNAEELRVALREKLLADEADQALVALVANVREALYANKGEPIRLEFHWLELLSVAGAVAATWLAILLVQRVTGGKLSPPVAGASPLAQGASMVGLGAALRELLRQPAIPRVDVELRSDDVGEVESPDGEPASADGEADGSPARLGGSVSPDDAQALRDDGTPPSPSSERASTAVAVPSSAQNVGGIVFEQVSKTGQRHD